MAVALHDDDGRRIAPLPSEHDPDEGVFYSPAEIGRYRGVMMHEGSHCRLYYPHAYTYKWHKVTAIQEFLRLSRFSHLTFEDAASCFSTEWRLAEPTRYSEYSIYHMWAEKFGLYCRYCKQIVTDIDLDNIGGFHHRWGKHEMCASCIISSHREGYETLKRQRAERELRKRLDEAYERRQLAAREAAEKQKRKRQLEKAAYELLSELGVLEQLENRNDDAGGDGSGPDRGKAAKLVQGEPPRPSARDHDGKPSRLRERGVRAAM